MQELYIDPGHCHTVKVLVNLDDIIHCLFEGKLLVNALNKHYIFKF